MKCQIIYDVIIIGGGPAGLTAGIYTSRHNYSTLILESNKVGGKAHEADWIENYPGFPEGIAGSDLTDKMEQQAIGFGSDFRLETVYGVNKFNDIFMVLTRSGEIFQSRCLIIATGVNRKSLNVPGENEFKGRGVSYCGVCDGPFFSDKTVAVIGSGKDAVYDIEILLEVSTKIYGVPGIGGYSEDLLELRRLEGNSKVIFLQDVEVVEIGGSDFVEYLLLDNGVKVKVDGVFVILERISMAGIFKELGLETDEGGCLLTDKKQKTSVGGIFAAGDCCCQGFQVVTATGMGAIAALNAMKYVNSVRNKTSPK